MFNPVSTYRIQFHKDFTFRHLEQIIPYLHKMGIGTIYASPIFEAVPGSTHGYDGTDPLKINPEIGTLEQLKKISKKLKSKNINWIQDIVPNHMAFHPNNKWLMDVLERGPESDYYNYFDLTDNEPLMVPFLGSSLDEVIDNGELAIEQAGKKLVFNYVGNRWPLNIGTYPKSIADANADKDMLKQIAAKQYYRLCSWKETDSHINYRRFFTVNGLICINIQNNKVFDQFHRLINTLLKEDIFQGLRLDHIDGLYDPATYLQQLRRLTGTETYIIAEKILEPGEQMPAWPIQGNTGYDFLGMVNNLFTNNKSRQTFTEYYQKLSNNTTPVDEQIKQKKAYILNKQMDGELENLTRLVDNQRVPTEILKQTIAQLLIRCPVYRYYGNQFPLSKAETKAVKIILNSIINDKPELKPAVKLLKKLWLGKNAQGLQFYQRCMQFTGPLMAKGVEDTLMYTYNRFIAHNEVGDAPDAFGISAGSFHKKMLDRQRIWPLSMNGTSTHDTKRGEDARARLNVLTDAADEWLHTVSSWHNINPTSIDPNDEYFIYETLIGTYPMPGEPDDDYSRRISEYLEKTLREAKLHSGWAKPNEAYETEVKKFAKNLLKRKGKFWTSFSEFHQKVASFGLINSLSQVLLKLTTPGMPDIYQGCELWDFSLVDPDNRRPVDYELRDQLIRKSVNIDQLWQNKFNGQIKLWLHKILLQERKTNPLTFVYGDYIALQTDGKYKANVMAYARKYKQTWYIIVVTLNVAAICNDVQELNWEDTHIILPQDAPTDFTNMLTNANGKLNGSIEISLLFKELPLAFLKLQLPESHKAAGILMHITSLPSPFATGDLGPGAKAFADLLHKSSQKYWQLLPLSPVNEKDQFSPYSSWSAMGGNVLLISPELLADEGLLADKDLELYKTKSVSRADFKAASQIKEELFELAWSNYKCGNCSWLKSPFKAFCKTEAYWLNDFALYTVLKEFNNGKPWHQWADKHKLRKLQAINDFAAEHAPQIEKAQWLQFIFSKQWQQLKAYCNQLDIKLFGDLPFYVSYDSVDVWANPKIFKLQKNLDMHFVAGVPPDYFNADGQLWGMPVFNWDELKKQNYDWWINRVKKNLELFDLLRLDHFRAFSSFWAVNATQDTAINGTWKKGPGADFFNALKTELGQLPLVAEDLGDIDEAVYSLRDEFDLPGMKVLQFAFGDDMPQSPHILHNQTANHVVYTGTHDNNTTKGWFNQDADKTVKQNLKSYTGNKVKPQNISKTLIKMALSSVADIAIIPMQDLLGLDDSARMNMPAGTDGNWTWRITFEDLDKFNAKKLSKWTKRYNRE